MNVSEVIYAICPAHTLPLRFSDLETAEAYLAEHGGRIISPSQIDPELLELWERED